MNILRGATSILVAIVTHPQTRSSSISHPSATPPAAVAAASTPSQTGIAALKPIITHHPDFFPTLVSRLSSADHALCANSLQLINALMREAITSEGDADWPRFIRQLQDLGVIRAVHGLMQAGGALQDLAGPVLEFQALMKVLLRRWREVSVDTERPEHRRAMKAIYSAGKLPDAPLPVVETRAANGGAQSRSRSGTLDSAGALNGKLNNTTATKPPSTEKWRRLGFATEHPAAEFAAVGFLGLMDLTDFIRRDEDGFRRLLAEQALQAPEQRCPLARASIAVTTILYAYFEVDDAPSAGGGAAAAIATVLATASGPQAAATAAAAAAAARLRADTKLSSSSHGALEQLFQPSFLQWSRLHSASITALLNLWQLTHAHRSDFSRLTSLIQTLIAHILGAATRTTPVDDLESRLRSAAADLPLLRRWQVADLDAAYERAWRAQLGVMRAELRHEALLFVKEQRIRCLLAGAWFAIREPKTESKINLAEAGGGGGKDMQQQQQQQRWRFVRLSHNRRHLHHAEFSAAQKAARGDEDVPPEALPEKIDLGVVSSVVSNTSTSNEPATASAPAEVPTPQKQLAAGTSSSSVYLLLPAKATASAPGEGNTLITIRRLLVSRGSVSNPRPAVAASSTPATATPTSPNTNTNLNGNTTPTASTTQIPLETDLLSIQPASSSVASEWLDGLLMLLEQTPITAETGRLVDGVAEFGLSVRLLNVRGWGRHDDRAGGAGEKGGEAGGDGEGGDGDRGEGEGREGREFDVGGAGGISELGGMGPAVMREGAVQVPSREGCEGGFWYQMVGE